MSSNDVPAFTIHACDGGGLVEFYDFHKDSKGAVESFSVRLTVAGLSATIGVTAGYSPPLAGYFEEIARNWRGWSGSREWSSLEGECTIKSTNDGRGHIAIDIRLRQNVPAGWTASATISTEAGLLERIAADCRRVADGHALNG